MNQSASSMLRISIVGAVLALLGACGKQEAATPAAATPAQTAAPESNADAAAINAAAEQPTAEPAAEETAAAAPTETISETDDGQAPAGEPAAATAQSALKLEGPASGPPTSAQFKEGTHYKKLVPAQPTGVAPGKVEVVEVFWYGCGHCFALDPAIESWRNKAKAPYVEFVRVPAMWNDNLRVHARLFYTAEVLGKLDALHPLIFREINVKGEPLTNVDRIKAFFKQNGVSEEEFTKAFSSFTVESKLQRADFLNRRYRVQSVPMVVVNGKYSTDVHDAGGEPALFALINELAAHEHGG